MPNEYEIFFDLLDRIINRGPGTWKERKAELLANASDLDKTNLAEFAAWDFEEQDQK